MLLKNIQGDRAALGMDAGVDLNGFDRIQTRYLTTEEYIVNELPPHHEPRLVSLIGEAKLEDRLD